MTNQGAYSNPIVPVYLFPRGDDFNLIKVFERWDPARKIKTMYWPQGEGDLRMQNPYWIAYRNLRTNNKKRYMLSASLSYDITDWLNVSGRVRVDNPIPNMSKSCTPVRILLSLKVVPKDSTPLPSRMNHKCTPMYWQTSTNALGTTHL